VEVPSLIEQFEHGLDAPICLTWELTYACNLACVHCLSSSGKRDPRELSTRQCMDIVDELERMQVFYVNIGGGEPTVRPDFWELVDYATAHHVGVKFSTNGVRITPESASRHAASDYVDVQISLDGATAEVNDAVRGTGSFAMAIGALENLSAAGFKDAKISVVVTATTSINSTNSPRWQHVTARRCGSPGCGRRVAALMSGTSCTRRPNSRFSCTTCWSHTASGYSRATRSSTLRRSARRARWPG
jgi:mycofactocin radical SAM maturase